MKIEHLLVEKSRRRTRTATQAANVSAPTTQAANVSAPTVSAPTTSGAVTNPTPVNLTATPATATNVPATAPTGAKPSGWDRVKQAGATAADALGSVGRGVGKVAGTVGDVATGLGNVAGGVGNLAARTVGGVAQTVGAIGGGLKAGYKGQDYNAGKRYSSGSSEPSQWGNADAAGSTASSSPDEVDDLRATIRSMDQRLRRAGI